MTQIKKKLEKKSRRKRYKATTLPVAVIYMTATYRRHFRKMKMTKDKSSFANSSVCSLCFNLSSWENNWKLILVILFITNYNLALTVSSKLNKKSTG